MAQSAPTSILRALGTPGRRAAPPRAAALEPGDTPRAPVRAWPVVVLASAAAWGLAALAALARPGEAASAALPAYGAASLAAACAYRLALGAGWPRGAHAQLQVLVLHLVLAGLVVTVGALALHYPAAAAAPLGVSALRDALGRFLVPYALGLAGLVAALLALARTAVERERRELQGELASARLAMLSAQLQPHFLFNSLHGISVLIDDSPRRAAAMIARLGDFLRHALESSRWPWTDLAAELAGIEAYLAVQQMRFGDALQFTLEASPEALRSSVPALLLQPLVENAIEHGRRGEGAELYIHVYAGVIGERLSLIIRNSSPHLTAALSRADFGHGLTNVELRLRAAYGAGARFSVAPDPRGGTAAHLDLPHREFRPARASHAGRA